MNSVTETEDVTAPYRELVERAFCQQRIELPVPEIDSDGSEISHRLCLSVARERCARCGLRLCDEHAPPAGRRCDPCESQFERAMATALGDTVLLTPRHRAIRTGLSVALIAGGFMMPWLTIELVLGAGSAIWALAVGVGMYALALHLVDPVKEHR